MSIKNLTHILVPPLAPVDVGRAEEWDTIERQVGKLPDDYKMFIGRFGTGIINNFLWVLNPASSNQHLHLLREGEPILSALRELRQAGEQCPYPLYPEIGGLFPFGKTDNGDALFWLQVGEPNQWPVVVNAARDPEYQKFNCGMADFLAGILTQRIRCSIFPAGFPGDQQPSFAPMSLNKQSN